MSDCGLQGSSFMLFDFQGHVLDISMNNLRIRSFPRNANVNESLNQQWSFAFQGQNSRTSLVSGYRFPSSPIELSWDADHGRTSSSLQQPLAYLSGDSFLLNQIIYQCIDPTSAYIMDPQNNFSLTAWEAASGAPSSPVTFEPFTGRAAQAWTIEALD